MIQKPRLKTFLTIFPISDTIWGLRGGSEELWRIKLSDERAIRAFSGVLPYLNGCHYLDHILDQVSEEGIDKDAALKLLEHLEESSLIEDADPQGLSPHEIKRFSDQLAFFSRFTSEGGAKYQSHLRDTKVGLLGGEHLGHSVLRHLERSGFGEVTVLSRNSGSTSVEAEQGVGSPDLSGTKLKTIPLDRNSIWPSDQADQLPEVFIVAQDSYDPNLLQAMDVFSKKHKIPWLLLRTLDPNEGWVGPLFIPGDTASYVSLEARLRGNIQFFDEYQAFDENLRKTDKSSAHSGGLLTVFDLLSGIAVTEIIKYVTGIAIPQLAGRFLTINLITWETEIHEVLRVPRLERESYSRPRIFSWKEAPYSEKETRRA